MTAPNDQSVTRVWLAVAADCARFLLSVALLVARWAALTLAIFGLGVVVEARNASDAAALGAMLIDGWSGVLRLTGFLAAVLLMFTWFFTGAGPLLPPRWRAWRGRQLDRLEAWCNASWAKIPARTQTVITVTITAVLFAVLAWIVWQAPEPNPALLSPETVR